MFKKPTNKRELLNVLKAEDFHVAAVHSGNPKPLGDYVKKLPWREVTVIVLRAK